MNVTAAPWPETAGSPGAQHRTARLPPTSTGRSGRAGSNRNRTTEQAS